jgi:hypothetical protein
VKGYCALAVVGALDQAVGKDRIHWETAAVPNQDYVELRVTYDPAQLDYQTIVAATKAAMEANPDPGYPGPVRVAVHAP